MGNQSITDSIRGSMASLSNALSTRSSTLQSLSTSTGVSTALKSMADVDPLSSRISLSSRATDLMTVKSNLSNALSRTAAASQSAQGIQTDLGSMKSYTTGVQKTMQQYADGEISAEHMASTLSFYQEAYSLSTKEIDAYAGSDTLLTGASASYAADLNGRNIIKVQGTDLSSKGLGLTTDSDGDTDGDTGASTDEATATSSSDLVALAGSLTGNVTDDAATIKKINDELSSRVDKLDSALNVARSTQSSFSASQKEMTTRNDFIQTSINNLSSSQGTLDYTDVMSDSGARMMAASTAAQLGSMALSLANQSQQAVMRLFG